MALDIAFAAVHAPDWLALGGKLDKALRCGVTALDIRIASLAGGASRSERELARIAGECGIAVRCHSWVGSRDNQGNSSADFVRGRAQGKQAATVAQLMGAESFGVNAEREVWRGYGGLANPKAQDFLDGFCDAFYEVNRISHLEYVGFADPKQHYRPADSDDDGDPDTDIPEDIRIRFRTVGVMAYQSRLVDLERKMARAVKRWPEHATSGLLRPWVGVGRIDADGKPVGDEVASKTLFRRYGGGVLYVGFGAIGQVLDGHDRHGPLVGMVADLRAFERAALA